MYMAILFYNAAKRRFSPAHYKRALFNGETVARSWLVYSQDSDDKVFYLRCKRFGNSAIPFSCGVNTWKVFAKELEVQENGVSHKKCFGPWLLLTEGISTGSAVDGKAMQIFLAERTFWSR